MRILILIIRINLSAKILGKKMENHVKMIEPAKIICEEAKCESDEDRNKRNYLDGWFVKKLMEKIPIIPHI